MAILHENRAALIDQIEQARETLKKLVSHLLQSAPVERDRFMSHPYQPRMEYRRTCETAGKSGKQIERCVIISSFQFAESMGFKRDFRRRQLKALMVIGKERSLCKATHPKGKAKAHRETGAPFFFSGNRIFLQISISISNNRLYTKLSRCWS